MTLIVTRISATGMKLSLAEKELSFASISNLSLAFLDAAFADASASQVTDSTRNDLSVVFTSTPSIVYTGSVFHESTTLVGTIENELLLTLSGDVFANGPFVRNVHYTVANEPAGLTLSAIRDSASQTRLLLSGTATTNQPTNSIANLTFNFLNAAFVHRPAAQISHGARNDLGVSFKNDPFNLPPQAIVSNSRPIVGEAPFALTLLGDLSIDPDGQVTRWLWNYGDGFGLDGSISTPTHLFAVPGSYRVTLQVFDNQGAASETEEVEVLVTGKGKPARLRAVFKIDLRKHALFLRSDRLTVRGKLQGLLPIEDLHEYKVAASINGFALGEPTAFHRQGNSAILRAIRSNEILDLSTRTLKFRYRLIRADLRPAFETIDGTELQEPREDEFALRFISVDGTEIQWKRNLAFKNTVRVGVSIHGRD